MPKVPSSLKHIYGSDVLNVGGLYLLQQLIEKGDLKFSEIMDKDIYGSPGTLSHRLRNAEEHGLIIRKPSIIPGKPISVVYSVTEYGPKVASMLEQLEKTIEEAKSKVKK